jgi:pyroglutamyl-peptidase
MRRVVLTSFEPFGSHSGNSSLEVGRLLARRPPRGVELDWVVLPVVAGRCVEQARARVADVEPHLVLCLGQAAGSAGLRVECVAVNRDDFRIEDNAGNRPRDRVIVPGGPARCRATTPGRHLVGELRRRRIPARLSGSAGTYVCNHLFYGLLHAALREGRTHRTGFLHLPLFPEQLGKNDPTPARDLELLAEGVRLALAAALEHRPAVASSGAPDLFRRAPGPRHTPK